MSYCTRCGQNTGEASGICPYCGNNMSGVNTESPRAAITPKKYNLFTAFAEMFKRYADFKGRSTRSEYWYVYLIHAILGFIAVIAVWGIGVVSYVNHGSRFEVIAIIVYLVMILYSLIAMIPFMALSVRRLHDTGKSGWFYLLVMIPSVGEIIIIVLMAMDSEKGVNKYGPNPKGE